MTVSLLDDAESLDLAARLRPDRAPAEVLAAIAWSVLAEPGDAVAGTLREHLAPQEAIDLALSDTPSPITTTGVLREARKRWRPRAGVALLRDAVASACRVGAGVLLPDDEAWPAALNDLEVHGPAMLWTRGAVSLLTAQKKAVSLVGARAATPYGEQMARELSGDLALAGHAIVSGGAYGIDGAAHRAALGVGGVTVAFLAGGVDRVYPAGHARLLGEIADRGAVLSEVPCGQPPTKWRFLARNRLIAALGGATVVVEAGWRSGSLNTAGHAAALGRPLGAVPGPVTSAASAGCHRLLREYDAHCVTSAEEVRELLGEAGHRTEPASVPDHESLRLCDALSMRAPRTPEDIARRSGLSVERVEALLGILALDGIAERMEGGWRRRVPQ